jgi:5-methyltetrahydropteroyltriglutamate--homocysteine methyltransferase
MIRSIDRIRTTHCGSLARPEELLDLMRARLSGQSIDADNYESAVRQAVADAVANQVEVGLDVVSDGEQGKVGHATYIGARLSGFEARPALPSESPKDDPLFASEVESFPEYYQQYFSTAMLGGAVMPRAPLFCTGPVEYRGEEALRRELHDLKSVLAAVTPQEAFVAAIAPSGVGSNEYYDTEQDYLFAVADALHVEYRHIIDEGFLLQVDDPFLTEIYSYPKATITEKRGTAELYVEAINRAIKNLPAERIRFHTCYGINEGPRVYDIPLEEIIGLVLTVNAGAYSFENANPRHEHEYHLWERVSLPEGKVIIPGVITHSTNVVEHPELIAERLCRFAKRVGRENVIAGADCGFSSQATYKPEVHPSVVWAKMRAMVHGARLATAQLWK